MAEKKENKEKLTVPEEAKPKAEVSSAVKKDEGAPLVFISHDARDAKLAEAFSRLLKRVSAGALKSFRSSDRTATEGIQYGDEWYKRLMENLNDASDVVCLFTNRSINRPWILFEAGVAKGALDTPVHGIAIRVPLSQVSVGPFYQFQNCQDDEESLTGLVLQLVRRIPNTDPDLEGVQIQVKEFNKEVDQVLTEIDEEGQDMEGEYGERSEPSAAKLFEEIKVMVRDLPSNLEDRFSEGIDIPRSSRITRFPPKMFVDMMHMSPDPFIGILSAVSFFRDDLPWLYEIGAEAYRASVSGRKHASMEALSRLRRVFEITFRSPLGDEILSTEEAYVLARELDLFLRNFIDRETVVDEEKEKIDEF